MTNDKNFLNFFLKLLYYGRDYPSGYDYFRTRLRKGFIKNKHVQNPEEINKLIERGEFIIKEVEALYKLKKYRTLKKHYYDREDNSLEAYFEKLHAENIK